MQKTAIKGKEKNLYAGVAKFGKKAGSLKKSFTFAVGGKSHGLNPKGVASEKLKFTYASQMPHAAQLRDASPGVMELAGFPTTGMETTPIENETELAGQLVAEVADQGADVNALCETYQLRREELGRLTGFSLRALGEWAAGKLPSQPAKRRLQEVRRLLDALAQIVKPEGIPNWLHQRNPAFDKLTPLQVIELGEIDRLWAMVHDMGSGQPE